MPKKKLDAATMLQSANAETARAIIEAAEQESTEAPAPAKPAKKTKAAEQRTPGRPRSERVCKLNITLTEEDKDYLRRLAFERTNGRQIVSISDVIAEYIEADRKKQQRKAKK